MIPRKLDFDPINISVSAFREVRPETKLANGAIYIGEWSGKFRDGKGKCSWPDGSVY